MLTRGYFKIAVLGIRNSGMMVVKMQLMNWNWRKWESNGELGAELDLNVVSPDLVKIQIRAAIVLRCLPFLTSFQPSGIPKA